MKKISLFVIILGVIVLLTGCGSKNVEGSLEDLMAKMYEGFSQDEIPMMLMNTEVNEENIEYYLGTSEISYKEALASEPGVTSTAHSIVLVRLNDDANVQDAVMKIRENVNPRKWLCTGVEEDEVIIKTRGNLLVLIMSKEHAKYSEKFDNL